MRNINKILACLLALITCACAHVYAQESQQMSDSLMVYFHQGKSDFDPDFKGNGERYEKFISRLQNMSASEARRVAKVRIYSSASPEGSVAFNEKLAQNRAKSVIERMHGSLMFQDSIVFIQHITEDWEGLARLAENDPAVPSKAEAMAIIRDAADPDRKVRLQRLDEGRAWQYLYEKYFPQLRSFRIYVYVRPTDEGLKMASRIEPVNAVPMKQLLLAQPSEPQPEPQEPQWTRELTLKTNTLGWALAHANIAVECDIIPHLSLAVPFYYSGGLDYFKPTIKFRGIVLQPELRYYPRLQQEKNDGFYVGAHFGLGWYNYALNGEFRIQDHKGRTPAYGGGIGLGYAMQFKKNPRWGMEFAVGGGVYKAKYDIFYNEFNGPYEDTAVEKVFFGVDNASVSFTYKFDLSRKGGNR